MYPAGSEPVETHIVSLEVSIVLLLVFTFNSEYLEFIHINFYQVPSMGYFVSHSVAPPFVS